MSRSAELEPRAHVLVLSGAADVPERVGCLARAERFEVVRGRIDRPIDRLEVPVGRSVRSGRATG